MENNVNNPSTFDEIRSQYNIYKQQYDSLWEHFGNNNTIIILSVKEIKKLHPNEEKYQF